MAAAPELLLSTDLVLLVKVEQQVLVQSATQERARQSSTVDTTICNKKKVHKINWPKKNTYIRNSGQ